MHDENVLRIANAVSFNVFRRKSGRQPSKPGAELFVVVLIKE